MDTGGGARISAVMSNLCFAVGRLLEALAPLAVCELTNSGVVGSVVISSVKASEPWY